MAKLPKTMIDEELRIVLAALSGKFSAAEAARRSGVAEQSEHGWKRQFIDGGRRGLETGTRRRSSIVRSDSKPKSRI